MLNFNSDYICGAVPEIMETLQKTNLEASPGYGLDKYCEEARRLILDACGLSDGVVQFVIGGTEANSVVVDGLLGKCQGVIAAETSHVNVHEAGTIEAFGHKVLSIPSPGGKITASGIDRYVTDFYRDETWEHMVAPGMVYITFPTELGTLYSRHELKEIAAVCRRHGLPLYIDGARLGYGLASPECDVTLPEIAQIADIFYIGGTKQGALFGEAIVSRRRDIIPRLFSLIKQHGALLAKGRLLGLQFKTLFTDDLYFRYASHAVGRALRLKELMQAKGFPLYIDSYTNQQFFVLSNSVIETFRKSAQFELWGAPGREFTPVRLTTSWSTTDADIEAFGELLSHV